MTKICFVGDLHVPYHNKAFTKYTIARIAKIRPDIIIAGGDWCDWYALSNFSKDPARLGTLQSDLDQTNEIMGKFSIHTERLIYIVGNHEERLVRYRRQKAPELDSLRAMSLSNLMELDKIDNVELMDFSNPEFEYGKMLFVHGHRLSMHSSYSAKLQYDFYGGSGVMGHCHRTGFYSKTMGKITHTWFEAGGLFDIDQADWTHRPNWTNAFMVFEFTRNQDLCHVEYIGSNNLSVSI